MTYKEVYKEFKKYGLTLLEDKYINNSTRMKCVDDRGYLFYTSLNNLPYMSRIRIADDRNPYKLFNIQHFIDLNTDGAILLNDNLGTVGKEKLHLRCRCGNDFYKSWHNITRDKLVLCPKCIKEHNSKKLNNEVVKQRFAEYGLELLESYTNNSKSMLCKDNKGYLVKSSLANVSKKHYRFSVKFNKENYIYNVNNYFKLHNINCEALYLNGQKQAVADVIICKCECGKEFHTTMDSIKQGQYRCQSCSKHISRAEYKCLDWLKSNNIEYIHQYKVDDCKLKHKLPFDFYIPSYNIIIEIDGEQHKRPTPFGGNWENAIKSFNHTIISDGIKNEYCKQNNIKLIRISTSKFRTNKYKEILSNLFC